MTDTLIPTPERIARLGERYQPAQRREAPHTISRLWDRVNLSDAEREAVDKFTRAYFEAQRSVAVNAFEPHSGAYGSRTFSDRLLDAITEHKEASRYLGLRHSSVVHMATLGDASLAQIGRMAIGEPKANANKANGAGQLALKMAAEMLCRFYDRPG